MSEQKSSNKLLLIIIALAVVGAVVAYQQGAFNDESGVTINLPNGESISGSISTD
jgi:hypothetical protein